MFVCVVPIIDLLDVILVVHIDEHEVIEVTEVLTILSPRLRGGVTRDDRTYLTVSVNDVKQHHDGLTSGHFAVETPRNLYEPLLQTLSDVTEIQLPLASRFQ